MFGGVSSSGLFWFGVWVTVVRGLGWFVCLMDMQPQCNVPKGVWGDWEMSVALWTVNKAERENCLGEKFENILKHNIMEVCLRKLTQFELAIDFFVSHLFPYSSKGQNKHFGEVALTPWRSLGFTPLWTSIISSWRSSLTNSLHLRYTTRWFRTRQPISFYLCTRSHVLPWSKSLWHVT